MGLFCLLWVFLFWLWVGGWCLLWFVVVGGGGGGAVSGVILCLEVNV